MRARPILLLTLSLAAAGPLLADTTPAEERLRAQLKQTTLDLRAAQDELSTLRAQQAAAKTQLDAAQAAASAAAKKPAAPAADPRLARLSREQAAELDALKAKLDAQQRMLEQAQAAAHEAGEAAKAREVELKDVQARIDPALASEKTCRERNARLVQIGNELLDRYKSKGVIESLRDAEPFTQLHRVQLEQAAQDYHGRIVDGTLPTPTPTP